MSLEEEERLTLELPHEEKMLIQEVETVVDAAGRGVIISPEPRLESSKSAGPFHPRRPVNQFTARNPHDNSVWIATRVKM